MTTDTIDDHDLERRLRAACSAAIPRLLADPATNPRLGGHLSEPGPPDVTDDGPVVAEFTGGVPPPRRRWPVSVAAALLVAVGVGALALSQRRHEFEPAAANLTPASTVLPASEPAVATVPESISLGEADLCDDFGCANFDPLPLAPGAVTFYRSETATAYGVETTQLDRLKYLARCAELTEDGTACSRIEGIAGVGLVEYGGGPNVEPTVGIGTTYTSISPEQYAAEWGPTQGGGETSPVSVRGHDGVRYQNESRDGLVWQEAPGVLVWVAVDPNLADELLGIAESVETVDPTIVPDTIPHRVVVPGLPGEGWQARDNDSNGVMVGLHDGIECVGFGYINRCGTELEDRVIVTATGGALRISGSTPPDVTTVRVAVSADDGVHVETVPFAPYGSRFFTVLTDAAVFDDSDNTLTVEWLDANEQVVRTADVSHLTAALDAGMVTTSAPNTAFVLPRPADASTDPAVRPLTDR